MKLFFIHIVSALAFDHSWSPSHAPSKTPSHVPTHLSPSHVPTHLSPSHVPSKSPSHVPTHLSPSHVPSKTPSHVPSKTPSHAPSHAPSKTPSHAPTHLSPSHAPSHAPTHLSPSHAPSHSPTHVRGSCIHGSGNITLVSDKRVPIHNVSIGMMIQTADRHYNIGFNNIKEIPHDYNLESATFLTLITEKNKQIILTPDHIIPTCYKTDVPARELYLGDCILTIDGKENIIDIQSSIKNGVYTVITKDAYIVVNDIIVSPYSVPN